MTIDHSVANRLLAPSAGLLLAAVCALGMAAFTGLIPGKAAPQDAFDVAAHFGNADSGAPAAVCGADCGRVERIRVMHAPRAGGVEAAGDGNLFSNAINLYTGNASGYLASFERRYRLTIRMPDRSTRVATLSSQPQYAVGDRVILTESGSIVRADYDI